MPELELDTVWEGGEISTCDDIDGGSSISSMFIGTASIPNISQQHKLANNITSETLATKSIGAVIQLEPSSIELENVATVVHERNNLEIPVNGSKSRLNRALNNEHLLSQANTTDNKQKETREYVVKNTQENTIQATR